MAQEKNMNEKPKRTRKPKAKDEALPVEQITELMLVHNKNDPKAGVRAVSGIDGQGKVKTVPADERNENSFLKFDKNSSILENFIKNFWSQLKNPTHFRLIRMTVHDYKMNKQAIRDLAEEKQTDAVKEFLKRYEIRPKENRKEQNVNQEKTETMAKKKQQQPQQPQEPLQQSEVQQAAQGAQPQVPQAEQQPQAPRYRYNEDMIDWNALEKIGVSKASLEQEGLLDSMLKGYKTNKLVPLTLTLDAATIRMDARLSLIPMQNGQVGLGIHGIRKEPQLERPYFGHIFTEEDKKNLRESGNMGRVAELNLRGGTTEPCLISIDKNTNELVAVRQEHVYVQDEVRGVKLSPDEIQTLKNGGQVFVDGMISNKGKEFSATLQYSAERRGAGVHLSQGPGVQPAVPRRGTALPHPVEDAQRGAHHPGRGHETQELRRGVLLIRHAGQGDGTSELYPPQSGDRRNLHPEGDLQRAAHPRGQGAAPQGTAGLSGKHGQPQGRGVLRLRQAEHDHRQPAILPYPGRVQRAAGAAHPGGSVRPCVHRAGEGKPPGRKGHSHFRPEKQRKTVQLLPESQPRFRAVAVFPGQSGYPEGHFPPGDTGGQCPTTGAEEKRETGHVG